MYKIIPCYFRINLPFTGMASASTGQPLRNDMANEILGNDVQPASLVQASEAVNYSRSFKGKILKNNMGYPGWKISMKFLI